jgi:hypothetical protein
MGTIARFAKPDEAKPDDFHGCDLKQILFALKF